MVTLYAQLIINHRKTLSQIPTNLKAQVLEKLIEMGYDSEGNPLPKESTE